MSHNKNTKYTTYGILDPRTNKFVYVGQTAEFEKRKRKHLSLQKRPNIRTMNIKIWLHDALSEGIIPEFRILEEVKTEALSLQSELAWVKRLKAEGHELLNKWIIHQESAATSEACDADLVRPYVGRRERYGTVQNDRPRRVRDYTSAEADHSNKNWLFIEDILLRKLYAEGLGAKEISERLKRPVKGVRARLVRLGVTLSRKDARD